MNYIIYNQLTDLPPPPHTTILQRLQHTLTNKLGFGLRRDGGEAFSPLLFLSMWYTKYHLEATAHCKA